MRVVLCGVWAAGEGDRSMRSRSVSARNPRCPAAAAHPGTGDRRACPSPWFARPGRQPSGQDSAFSALRVPAACASGLTPERQEEVESGSLKAGPSYWPDAQGGAGGRAAEAEGPPRLRKPKGAGRTVRRPSAALIPAPTDQFRVTSESRSRRDGPRGRWFAEATSLRGRPVHRSAPPSEDSLCRFRPGCTSLGKSSSRRAPGGIQGADPRSEQARPDSNGGPSGRPPESCGKVQASIAAAVICPICPDVTAETGLEFLMNTMSSDRAQQRRSVAGFTRRHVRALRGSSERRRGPQPSR